MASKQSSLGKRFKKRSRKLSKNNQTSLTFEEKTGKLPAINRLIDRSSNDNTESYQDVISAFSSDKSNYFKNKRLRKQQERDNKNENKPKQKQVSIEYLTKDIHPAQIKKKVKRKKALRTLGDDNKNNNNNNITFEPSSNRNKRSFPELNRPQITPSLIKQPPKKKPKPNQNTQERKYNESDTITPQNHDSNTQKDDDNKPDIITPKDHYLLHWNTRYEDREKDLLPKLRRRRSTVMTKMQISHPDHACFIDSDCEPFAVAEDINSKLLNCHRDIITAYNQRSQQKWKNAPTPNTNRLVGTDSLLYSAMASYRDLLFCDRTYKNDKNIKQILTMHILSHILRKKDIQRENDMKLRRSFISDDGIIRDCGFKKLSVVIITPFRENVRKFGEYILANLPKERTLINQRYKKFKAYFGEEAKNNKLEGRGKEFEETFYGNIDDDFSCGIAIDRKGVNFLQSWFYSDIVLISPLRLKFIFEDGRTKDGKSIFDFFSSVEIMILDQLDVIQMQNIQHLFDTLHKINWHPKLRSDQDMKNVDFNRLRYCYVDDVAQFYRQNIFITKHQTPKIKQLFQQRSMNVFGKIKIENKRNHNGILEKIIPFVRQEFYRFSYDANNECDANELRLEIYKKYMLPIFRKNKYIKTLIFVSSYYDFLRLRKLYKNVKHIKFLSEYSIEADEKTYRRGFQDDANQDIMYLVITERYYFYRRLIINGQQRVLFYSLPSNKEYYYQVLNWFDTKKEYESYAIYCESYDNLALQRVVGLRRMIKMLNNPNNKQVFV